MLSKKENQQQQVGLHSQRFLSVLSTLIPKSASVVDTVANKHQPQSEQFMHTGTWFQYILYFEGQGHHPSFSCKQNNCWFCWGSHEMTGNSTKNKKMQMSFAWTTVVFNCNAMTPKRPQPLWQKLTRMFASCSTWSKPVKCDYTHAGYLKVNLQRCTSFDPSIRANKTKKKLICGWLISWRISD